METWVSVPAPRLPEPAVILIVMRKRLMYSSCILWPTVCSAICLCQLPLSPPTLPLLWKALASSTMTADRRAFDATHSETSPQPFWSSPVWLLSLAVDVEWHFKWQLVGQQPWQTCYHRLMATPEGPQQHLPSQLAMEPSQPNIFMPPDASVTQLGNHPLPLSLVFISYPSFLQPNNKLLGKGYPVIFSPSTE